MPSRFGFFSARRALVWAATLASALAAGGVLSVEAQAGETPFADDFSAENEASSHAFSQSSFKSLCLWRFTLPREKRATVEAIFTWARTKQQATTCTAAALALATAETIEVENASLTWPDPFREAAAARRLYLAGNAFLSAAFLSALPNLEVLDLRASPVSSLPDDVASRLKVLNVSGTRIASLSALSAATGLLDLNAHNLGLTSLEGLEHFPDLVSLGLANNRLTSLEGIEVAFELRSLYVADNLLADIRPAALLPYLRLINARGNPLVEPIECPGGLVLCIVDGSF